MFKEVGRDWLVDIVGNWTDHLETCTPVQYNEANRYIPASVSSMPGHMKYSAVPFMREIAECADPNSPIREVALMKGVQLAYTTAIIEAVILYAAGHIKTLPVMLVTADQELVKLRISENILKMFNESGMSHLLQSTDEGNKRKSGSTAQKLSWIGGGYLVGYGANSANKMRSTSVAILVRDEIDGWDDIVGKDGCPVALTGARCKGYWAARKIFDGSTPTLKGSSKIEKRYNRGDKRKYMVRCRGCKEPQELVWRGKNSEGGEDRFGIVWEMIDGVLDPESVRYKCKFCGHLHTEFDKMKMISEEEGAKWVPTAKPISPDVRSYHLNSLYSPFFPWVDAVVEFLLAFDYEARKVKDMYLYQVFINNVTGLPFEMTGAKVSFVAVSAHRRSVYRLGMIPNEYAAEHSGSQILFLTCEVDVHKSNLAVTVLGWCRDSKSYVIDYWRFEDEDCTVIDSPVWGRLRELIEEKIYVADDDTEYRLSLTLIDCGYANDTVVKFCAEFDANVVPIIGAARPAKNQRVKEFSKFDTALGTTGYRIIVDHYKDRLAPVLRREWSPESGDQRPYHFNAPVDITDKQLKELTVEYRREEKDDMGNAVFKWHRPGNAANELWDLLVYGNAGVDMLAYFKCVIEWELEEVDWAKFWDFMEYQLDPD